MCFNSNYPDTECKTAEEDLTVYKVMFRGGNVEGNTPSYMSQFQGFVYEAGKVYDYGPVMLRSFIEQNATINGNVFHSYANLKNIHVGVTVRGASFILVAVRCTIPKGSVWAVNRLGEVVSSAIKIDLEIKPIHEPVKMDSPVNAEIEKLVTKWVESEILDLPR